MSKPLNTNQVAVQVTAAAQGVISVLPKPPQSPSAASELPTKSTMPPALARAIGYRQ
jgi:hypothetical protein